MKTLKTILTATIFTGFAGTAMADVNGYTFDQNQLIPSGVRAEVGTTGYGGAFIWTPHPKVDLVLGYNGGDISWSDDLKINGSTYDLDMDNNNVYLNAQIRPWENWFYLAAGAAYTNNDYGLDRRVGSNASFTVDGSRFNAGLDGDVKIDGKMKYDNNIAPYLGLGFSPAINDRWGLFGEVGVYYTGNPTVNLRANSAALGLEGDDGRTLDEALRAEAKKIANDDKYEWLPVAKLGVSFRF